MRVRGPWVGFWAACRGAGWVINVTSHRSRRMMVRSLSLREHVGSQLRSLCAVVGLSDVETPVRILTLMLGAVGDRVTAQPPIWASHVSDDLTPVEFSIAIDEDGSPALRMLVEPI